MTNRVTCDHCKIQTHVGIADPTAGLEAYWGNRRKKTARGTIATQWQIWTSIKVQAEKAIHTRLCNTQLYVCALYFLKCSNAQNTIQNTQPRQHARGRGRCMAPHACVVRASPPAAC